MLTIDGSLGEGGGQVVRTALGLSALTGQTVEIKGIRQNRPQAGLGAQHLTAVNALAEICSARVEGNEPGSTHLRFDPLTSPEAGDYTFDVDRFSRGEGSAGSVLLVLQALVVPLTFTDGTSTLELRGGTHVQWSPPYHYVESVYLSALERVGYRVEPKLKRWGFYPRGKGILRVTVEGRGTDFRPKSLSLTRRGRLVELDGLSAVANLDPNILRRQTRAAKDRLEETGFEGVIQSRTPESLGPGTVVFLQARYEEVNAGFTSYGRKGKPAEQVAREAVDSFREYHKGNAPVDRFLADQLILPLAFGRDASTFRTTQVTPHLTTNGHLIKKFEVAEVQIAGREDTAGSVTVNPSDSE